MCELGQNVVEIMSGLSIDPSSQTALERGHLIVMLNAVSTMSYHGGTGHQGRLWFAQGHIADPNS